MSFLKDITMYKMTDKDLNQDQYNILAQERAEFIKLITAGYTRNITPGWLGKMRITHAEVFGGQVNINCTACIVDSMRRLWRKMEAFERKQAEITAQAAAEAIQASTPLLAPTEPNPIEAANEAENNVKNDTHETEQPTSQATAQLHQDGDRPGRGKTSNRWNPKRF